VKSIAKKIHDLGTEWVIVDSDQAPGHGFQAAKDRLDDLKNIVQGFDSVPGV